VNERRLDPTTGEWTTLSSARQDRTFLPTSEHCPLCPTRQGMPPTEIPRAEYDVVVFDNRFPALMAEPPPPSTASGPLHRVAPAVGATEVVVYSDDHAATLADLGAPGIRRLVEVWAHRYEHVGRREEVAYVLIFENKGEAMGVTLHHPHGQIYGYPEIPPRPRLELATALEHLRRSGTCVYCDVVARERSDGVRVVDENSAFVAFVPFAARYPYEIHVTARRHAPSLLDLSDPERDALAGLLASVLRSYDGLFGFSMPYVMVVHQAPTDDGQWQAVSHFHIELTPPHRSAVKLKYLAGSELGGGAFLNDIAPEDAAACLRDARPHRPG
jgi:UDPglucose--hexose-1-phosphate uridylyltransferase